MTAITMTGGQAVVESLKVNDCGNLLKALDVGIKKDGPFLIEIIF